MSPQEAARLKSYTGPAVVVVFLLCVLPPVGVWASYLYLKEATRMETEAGQRLPGVGVLRFVWHTCLTLVSLLVGAVVIGLIGMRLEAAGFQVGWLGLTVGCVLTLTTLVLMGVKSGIL